MFDRILNTSRISDAYSYFNHEMKHEIGKSSIVTSTLEQDIHISETVRLLT